MVRIFWIPSFSFCQWTFMAAADFLSSPVSFSIFSRRSFETRSFSFKRACRSISSCVILRSISSNSTGMLSISILRREAASSIKSIALSGRKRSEM